MAVALAYSRRDAFGFGADSLCAPVSEGDS